MLVSLLAAEAPRHAVAASASQGLAGHWVAQLLLRFTPDACVLAPEADPWCTLAKGALGPVTVAVTMDIVSDAMGSGPYTYEMTIVGAGSGISPHCDARLYMSSGFKGVCAMTAHGKGVFDTAAEYFTSGDEWVTFHSTKTVREVHNAMAAGGFAGTWPIPPYPGYYDVDTVATGRDPVNLAMSDYMGGMAGLDFREVVARY